MKALLITVGSRGDVQPMVALALAMRRAGHEVRLAASTNAKALAQAHDLPFVDLGADVQTHLAARPEAVSGNSFALLKLVRELLDEAIHEQFRRLEPEMRWADLAVGAGLVNAPSSLAEAFGIPYRFAAFVSQALPSKLHVPYTLPWQSLPGWMNAALWRAHDFGLKKLAARAMNEHRKALGLSPVDRLSRVLTPPGSLLLAADPELSPPPLDYDPELPITGAWTLDSEAALSPELVAFLESGRPPVYVGFGSMTDADPAATTRTIVQASAKAGVRVLMSEGWAQLGAEALPDHCFLIGDTPHAKLFPRVAGVVHHGGAGTVATAARAGVPQMVVPHVMDQFYWAHRVHHLGLGPRGLPRPRLNVESLARSLRALSGQASYREASKSLAAKLSGRSGVEEAVKLLERVVAREARPTGS